MHTHSPTSHPTSISITVTHTHSLTDSLIQLYCVLTHTHTNPVAGIFRNQKQTRKPLSHSAFPRALPYTMPLGYPICLALQRRAFDVVRCDAECGVEGCPPGNTTHNTHTHALCAPSLHPSLPFQSSLIPRLLPTSIFHTLYSHPHPHPHPHPACPPACPSSRLYRPPFCFFDPLMRPALCGSTGRALLVGRTPSWPSPGSSLHQLV